MSETDDSVLTGAGGGTCAGAGAAAPPGVHSAAAADGFHSPAAGFIVASIEIQNGINALDALKDAQANARNAMKQIVMMSAPSTILPDQFLTRKRSEKLGLKKLNMSREMKLYTKRQIQECIDKTGKKPIAVRWIDANKGDEKNQNMRSRRVGK